MSNVIKWNFNLPSCLPIQSPLSVNYSEPPVSQFSFDICRFEASNPGYLKQVPLVWYPGLHLVAISSPSIIYTSKYYSPGVVLLEDMGIAFALTIFLPADMVIMRVDFAFAVGWTSPCFAFSYSQESCIGFPLGPCFVCLFPPHKGP